MSLWPRTLFGRVALSLTLILSTAQLIGFGYQYQQRHRLIRDLVGEGWMDEVVQTLTRMEQGQRMPMPMHAMGPMGHRQLFRERPASPPGALDHLAHRGVLESVIARRLSDRAWQLWVTPPAQLPAATNQMHPMGGMHPPWLPRNRAHLWLDVELQDGRWLRLRRPLPRELVHPPWRELGRSLLLILVAVVIAWWAIRYVTRPLKQLSQAAEGLGVDIERPPLPEQGPLEVSQAARAFNQMQRRIKRYLEDRTQFLAAVSHDLKTPITRLRLRAELLDQSERQQAFHKDLDEMETMIQATLDYMRSNQESEATQPVDINALIESLCEDLSLDRGEIPIQGQLPRAIPLKPLALRRCLTNLIQNALFYGQQCAIELRLAAEWLEIHVLDRGPGLQEDELELVFQPFYRVEDSRNRHHGGTGLGLSIARNIARSQGGDLWLRNRPRGGLDACLRLPLPKESGN